MRTQIESGPGGTKFIVLLSEDEAKELYFSLSAVRFANGSHVQGLPFQGSDCPMITFSLPKRRMRFRPVSTRLAIMLVPRYLR
jgi:hypothetical protein